MSGLQVEQNIGYCCLLAGFGGMMEVFATAVLAWPAARIAQGVEWSDFELKGALAVNILFQLVASISGNLLATWFGPVAVVGPIFFAAQLLTNLVVFWKVLGLEAFSREMQIGTYVVVVAVVLLIVNGPGGQDYGDKTFGDLITPYYALTWSIMLLVAMLVTGAILAVVDLNTHNDFFKMAVLLVARASGFSLNLSTGKATVLPISKTWLIINIAVKVISGIIYTNAIVVQSTAVSQKVFVPINAATIIAVNAITGIIIWEDWRVVSSWIGYVCVFLLLALGCGLLLSDLQPLHEASPETFKGARVNLVKKESRENMMKRLRAFGDDPNRHVGSLSFSQPLDAMESDSDGKADLEEAQGENTSDNAEGSVRSSGIRASGKRANMMQSTHSNKKSAWLSIYEKAGAAPQASMRMSYRYSSSSLMSGNRNFASSPIPPLPLSRHRSAPVTKEGSVEVAFDAVKKNDESESSSYLNPALLPRNEMLEDVVEGNFEDSVATIANNVDNVDQN